MRLRSFAPLAVSALIPLVSGCARTSETNGGLTNGPPPASASEKASMRTDIPGSPAPDRGESLGASGDNATNSGSGGMGGGTEGGGAKKSDATANPDTVRANPPAKGSPSGGSAAGGTKAEGTIKTGNSRSPQ